LNLLKKELGKIQAKRQKKMRAKAQVDGETLEERKTNSHTIIGRGMDEY
jgi:hypothetical protein